MRRKQTPNLVSGPDDLISTTDFPDLPISAAEAALALHVLREYKLKLERECAGIGPETFALKRKLEQHLFPKTSQQVKKDKNTGGSKC